MLAAAPDTIAALGSPTALLTGSRHLVSNVMHRFAHVAMPPSIRAYRQRRCPQCVRRSIASTGIGVVMAAPLQVPYVYWKRTVVSAILKGWTP